MTDIFIPENNLTNKGPEHRILKNILSVCLIVFFFLYNAEISSAQTPVYPQKSVLSSGKWYSISISTDGIYKLSYNDFINLGFSPQEIDFDNLSIFGNTGQAIDVLPRFYTQSDLKENAIYVNKQERYALFYAKATTKTVYDSVKNSFSFSLHPYSNQAKYFVTFDPQIGSKKRIQSVNTPEQYDDTSSVAPDYAFHKSESVNIMEMGGNWSGEQMTYTVDNLTVPMSLPNINPDYKAKLEVSLLAKSYKASLYTVGVDNTDVGNVEMLAAMDDQIATSGVFSTSCTINSSSPNINIKFRSYVNNARGWLNHILINYTKNLTLSGNFLRFYSLKNNKVTRFKIDNLRTDNYTVWDITDAADVKLIANTYKEGNSIYFNVQGDTLRNIAVFYGNSFPSPVFGDSVENQNLHGIDSCEFVIVSHKNFLPQADSLAEIHRKYDNIKVAVVDIDQVYNEYSSGNKDFLAIREFIRQMYINTGGHYPKNVLLFGDGTYDNKNILQYNNNFIPTYQHIANSYKNSGDPFTSDDILAAISYYAKNVPSDTLFVGIGRLPANTQQDADIMVEKIRRYISRSDLGTSQKSDWRNHVLLSSDDIDNYGEVYFTANAENIYYQITQTNPSVNIQKVYSDAYKEYSSASGATYPDASKAINGRMKKGCLLLNYLGHGSSDHLSGERLVTISDIISWDNIDKLCLMITSTCEFGRFDLVDKQSAGEYIVTSEHGAGIALISAARKISSNDPINKALHKYALSKDTDGKPYTFGQVMRLAKNSVPSLQQNERSITLLGDPALRISLPLYNVKTLQVNNSFFDEEKQVLYPKDTINALSEVTVKGEITNGNGEKLSNFNGNIIITLYDKKGIYRTLDNSDLDTVLTFEHQNNILHKGETSVTDGSFSYTFTVPKDIAYNYGKGKLSYYAYNDSIDAAGYTDDFIIGGIDPDSNIETEDRPIVSLFMNDTLFVSGGITDENPTVFAIVYDTVPINTVGSGLGHDITITLDNAANTFVLNDFYNIDPEDKNFGYISYPLTNLSEGKHTLKIKVWNIFNSSGECTIDFYVTKKSEAVYTPVSYPNPFENSVSIELRYNQPEEITEAFLEIFNSNGALVYSEDITPYIGYYTIGPVQWNAYSQNGMNLTSGMYFYNFILTTKDGKKLIKGKKMIYTGRK